MTELLVNEIFGPTIQGEGRNTGRRAVFLRLATCNLHCTWCDTPYTWDWKRFSPEAEVNRLDVDTVVHELEERAGGILSLLVITGGEPLIQGKKLREVINRVVIGTGRPFWRVEIETNGTLPPITGAYNTYYNVSPKLSHSGDPREHRIRPAALGMFVTKGGSEFKFVVDTPEDIEEVDGLVRDLYIPPSRVWLMPQGEIHPLLDIKLPWVAAQAIERGYNVTDRLHIRLWGGKRGH